MKELGTNVQLLPNHTTPQKTDTYFNRKMKTNRLENKFYLTYDSLFKCVPGKRFNM